jgi:hypothetical protein
MAGRPVGSAVVEVLRGKYIGIVILRVRARACVLALSVCALVICPFGQTGPSPQAADLSIGVDDSSAPPPTDSSSFDQQDDDDEAIVAATVGRLMRWLVSRSQPCTLAAPRGLASHHGIFRPPRHA